MLLMTQNHLPLFYYVKKQFDFLSQTQKMILLKKEDKSEIVLGEVISEDVWK